MILNIHRDIFFNMTSRMLLEITLPPIILLLDFLSEGGGWEVMQHGNEPGHKLLYTAKINNMWILIFTTCGSSSSQQLVNPHLHNNMWILIFTWQSAMTILIINKLVWLYYFFLWADMPFWSYEHHISMSTLNFKISKFSVITQIYLPNKISGSPETS
jgi:hypothetical protein